MIEPGRCGRALREEGAVVVARDEADLSAVGLVVQRQTHLEGEAPDLGLRVLAHREQQARELGLLQRVEDVGLVLAVVDGAVQLEAVVAVADARIVSRRKVTGVEGDGAVEQGAKLDVLVAGEAGVGRATALVLADEVVDDLAPELLLQVEDVVRDAEHLGRGARVVDVLDTAAALLMQAPLGVVARPETHRDAHDVVALLHEQTGGYGGIDAAAHRDDNTLLGHVYTLQAMRGQQQVWTNKIARLPVSCSSLI